jgi:thiol-disulfide isomerase/thioredoxin
MRKVIAIAIMFFIISSAHARDEAFSNLNGSNISYERLVSSPKTVFFVWALWCPYCLKEFERLSQRCVFLEGVEVFFINAGDEISAIRRFADNKSLRDCIREKIVVDREGFLADKFFVVGIPTFIFFKNGQSVFKSYYLDDDLLKTVFGEKPTSN